MNLEQLESIVSSALEPAFRAQLLARGQARSLIWRNGVVPSDGPPFAHTLSYDLISYGDALLMQAMDIRKRGGDEDLASRAFIQAGEAIEAVVTNGDSNDPQRGFLRVLSAAAFHLGRSSARAYSLMVKSIDNTNLSQLERGLSLLILRNFSKLEEEIVEWQSSRVASDESLVSFLNAQNTQSEYQLSDEFVESVLVTLNLALCDRYNSGLSYFLMALEIGEEELVTKSQSELQSGLQVTADLNLVPQWWCFRLTMQLIDDLWQASFHVKIPKILPDGQNSSWLNARSLLIALLYRRSKAEIELWPSQIEGASRAVDVNDNLVVSLPTSAGKTRIAELCILRCLSEGKRVVFVTPLRALSAQSESTLQDTFRPLGYSVSGMYGSMGTSVFEEDTLRRRDIVVATPEKLDFALRNDPSILDDVGLIVLDEGHMIGLGEREIRYEIQVQRLLNREDSNSRRIVCLSAVLPDGDKLDDFVKWIGKDDQGVAIRTDWRPTRQRYGEVLWRNRIARLELRVGEENPYVPTFFEEKHPLRGKRTATFPRNQRELVIATAWRLLEDGQSVLVYCPQRNNVNPYAKAIIDLESKGFIDSALEVNIGEIEDVLKIGIEWLGSDHPILQCLKLGVAIHHGALPTPFRKEMERLLRDGILRVTISSPTLAQGLNLTASAIIMHDIRHFRNGRPEVIESSDFSNVVGRAGRAYVDVEGLVLLPIFKDHARIQREWNKLLENMTGHDIESGLLKLLYLFLRRLNDALSKPGIEKLADYVLNNASCWEFPHIPDENAKVTETYSKQWSQYLPILDTAILSLVGDEDVPVEELSVRLDQLLSSSFWKKRIALRNDKIQSLFKCALVGRSMVIWNQSSSAQRRGYFLAGVGLTTGQILDSNATKLNTLLADANVAILEKDHDEALNAVFGLGELLFKIEPFIPDPFPDEWREVLRLWLLGKRITGFTGNRTDDILRFVENGLIYRLSWAVDAVRVRATANNDIMVVDGEEYDIEDLELGLLVPCLERGTLNPCAARLMQAGFTSRLAAIKAVTDTQASFENLNELKEWLRSSSVLTLSQDPSWPTIDSHNLWLKFVKHLVPSKETVWSVNSGEFAVSWNESGPPTEEKTVRLKIGGNGECDVLSPTFEKLGTLNVRFSRPPTGVFEAKVCGETTIAYTYKGPTDYTVI